MLKLFGRRFQLCLRCWNRGRRISVFDDDWPVEINCGCPKGRLREIRRLLTEATHPQSKSRDPRPSVK